MRVVKHKDWELVGFNSHGFVFKSTRYSDELMILSQAKYVLSKDVVLFMTLEDEPVVIPSNSTSSESLTSVYQVFQRVMQNATNRFQIA